MSCYRYVEIDEIDIVRAIQVDNNKPCNCQGINCLRHSTTHRSKFVCRWCKRDVRRCVENPYSSAIEHGYEKSFI